MRPRRGAPASQHGRHGRPPRNQPHDRLAAGLPSWVAPLRRSANGLTRPFGYSASPHADHHNCSKTGSSADRRSAPSGLRPWSNCKNNWRRCWERRWPARPRDGDGRPDRTAAPIPRLSRVLVEAATKAIRVQSQPIAAPDIEELERSLGQAARNTTATVLTVADAFLWSQRARIVSLATRHRLPGDVP
jgi:LmbE family N-acetylglucosaminyl deacetylase